MKRRILGIVTALTLSVSLFGTAEAFADTPIPDGSEPTPSQAPTEQSGGGDSAPPTNTVDSPTASEEPSLSPTSEREEASSPTVIEEPAPRSAPKSQSRQRAVALTPIQQKHQALGGDSGKLGRAIGPENCILKDGGCFQRFEGGSIHYSPSTGAHPTWGSIQSRWANLGYENGKLGYPIGAENCTLKDGGCYQRFQGGTIHYTPSTGAHPTWGSIQSRWANLGYENGKLGYPTSGEVCGLKNGGCYQQYQGGSIHYTPSTKAHPTWGSIQKRWGASKYEAGPFGYPIAAETCRDGACEQGFQGGVLTDGSRTPGQQAAAFAESRIGDAYRYGGTGPTSWDCSGLTGGAWKAAGVNLPRTSQQQYVAGKKISKSQLQPGDLVFYYSGRSHVGIYVGDGKIVHASRPGQPVAKVSVDLMPFNGAIRPA